MSNLENKEKNLNKLIEKLSNISISYTHSTSEAEKLKKERDIFLQEKNDLEKKQNTHMRKHDYLKNKLRSLQEEVNRKNEKEIQRR